MVREVVNAPNRRVDHEISRLTECAQLLIMHCKVLDCVSGEFFRSRLQLGSACFLAIGSCAALALQRVGLLLHSGFGLGLGSSNTLLKHSSTSSSTGKNNDLLAHLGVICVSTSAALGAYWLTEKLLHANALSLMSSSHLNEVYQAVYGQDIRDKNELVESLWRRVRSHLAVDSKLSSSRSAVSQIVNFLSTTPRVKQVELQSLQTILDKDVPHLRTQALTSHTKY